MSSRLLPPGYGKVIDNLYDRKEAHYKWTNRKSLQKTEKPSNVAFQYGKDNPYKVDYSRKSEDGPYSLAIDQVLGELPNGKCI